MQSMATAAEATHSRLRRLSRYVSGISFCNYNSDGNHYAKRKQRLVGAEKHHPVKTLDDSLDLFGIAIH